MVGAAVFGDGTLAVNQEAVPPPLLGQRVLVALGDVVVQLALLVADGFHKLRGEKWLRLSQEGGVTRPQGQLHRYST